MYYQCNMNILSYTNVLLIYCSIYQCTTNVLLPIYCLHIPISYQYTVFIYQYLTNVLSSYTNILPIYCLHIPISYQYTVINTSMYYQLVYYHILPMYYRYTIIDIPMCTIIVPLLLLIN